MVEENIGQEFRLKNIYETRNNFIEKIKQTTWWVERTKRFVEL